MRRTASLALGLVLSLVFAALAAVARGDHETGSVWSYLDDDTFQAAGLDKLTDQELAVLSGLLLAEPGPSFLAGEAEQFMEEKDWRPIPVVGVMNTDREVRLIVLDGYKRVYLRPFGGAGELPPPGVHWGKNTLSSWTLLNPNGKERSFIAM